MPPEVTKRIGAVVLAAGLSSRMGAQKLLLPWKDSNVICTVVDTLLNTELEKIVVVTGRDVEMINDALSGKTVETAFNADFANGNMVTSLVAGLRVLQGRVDSVLMVLGDQPQMQKATVERLILAWKKQPLSLCIPSWQMRRGHPWVIPTDYWEDLFAMSPEETMRDFIRKQDQKIHYVMVDSPTILADLDTPEDYQKTGGGSN